MSAPRILLVGYYGRANFGDDVLLNVTHGLLRRAVPDARFTVVADGVNGSYVHVMLGNVQVVPPGRHGFFDLIVHGGGGVFFDFKSYGVVHKITECALRLFGFRTVVFLERKLRRLLHRERTSAKHRIGIGIGVGAFRFGSTKLWRQSLPILSDLNALWVRDTTSIENLKRFESVMKAEIISGSDLAFLTEYWAPEPIQKESSSRKKLGIILRDWTGTDYETLRAMLATLSADYDLTGFIFDTQTDPRMQELLMPYATVSWQPQQMSIARFAQQLAMQDVLLSSRAHGVICGACVGVPSVVVRIEPKLEQVHQMLPESTVLVAANDMAHWKDAIEKALVTPKETIASEVAKNKKISEVAWLRMKRYLP